MAVCKLPATVSRRRLGCLDDAIGQHLERVEGDRTDALQFLCMQLFKFVAQTHQRGGMPFGRCRHLGLDVVLGVAQFLGMPLIDLLAQTLPVGLGGGARSEHGYLGTMFGFLNDPSQVGRMPLRRLVPDLLDDREQLGLDLLLGLPERGLKHREPAI